MSIRKSRLEQLRLAKKHLLNARSALEQANWTSKLQESVYDATRLVQFDIELEEKKELLEEKNKSAQDNLRKVQDLTGLNFAELARSCGNEKASEDLEKLNHPKKSNE